MGDVRQSKEPTNQWQLQKHHMGREPHGWFPVSGIAGKGQDAWEGTQAANQGITSRGKAQQSKWPTVQWQLQKDHMGKEPHGSFPVSGAEG